GAVVLQRGAHQGLEQKRHSHDKEEPAAHALCRSQGDGSRSAKSQGLLRDTMPSQKVPSTKRREQKTLPPNRAIGDRTLQSAAFAVTRFPTSGSGGQLLVYE